MKTERICVAKTHAGDIKYQRGGLMRQTTIGEPLFVSFLIPYIHSLFLNFDAALGKYMSTLSFAHKL